MSIINISSGNTTSGSVISSGTVLAILTGGVGYDTSLQGGVETVYAGGTAVDDIISSGSFDVISSGGTDTGATVANGGYLIALPGSIVDDTEVLPGGIVTTSTGVVLVTTWYNRGIFEGASTSGLDLDSSNELFVMSGGVVSSASVYFDIHAFGGPPNTRTEIYVFSGGKVVDTSLDVTGDLYISQGGQAINTLISDYYINTGITGGGREFVLAGGRATDTIINGGTEVVSSGGVSYGTTLNSGFGENYTGIEVVSSGGVTSGTTINLGGTEYILSGAVDEGSKFSNGTEVVSSGGTIYVTSRNQAGFLIMNSGSTKAVASGVTVSGIGVTSVISLSVSGVAENATIYSAGLANVSHGGSAIGTVISSGGQLEIHSGGVDSGSIIKLGGAETVLSGGTVYVSQPVQPVGLIVDSGGTELAASGTTISAVVVTSGIVLAVIGNEVSGTVTNGGTEIILAGGIDDYTTLSSGGTQYAASGGTIVGTDIETESTQILESDASANNTKVSKAGAQFVLQGATTVDAVVASSGFQYVYGDTSSTLVSGGGVATIYAGGRASDSEIASGGEVVVFGLTVNTNIASGGTEIIGVGGTDIIDSNEVLVGVYVSGGTEVLYAGDISGTISLIGSNNTLVIDGESPPTALITGITPSANDVLLMSGVAFVSGGSVTLAGDVVTIADGGSSYVLNVQASSSTPNFELVDQNGTLEVLVPCYTQGTRIMTEHGEMAVEDISVGIRLVMARADGPATRPVVWTGRRKVDLTRHPEREQVLPVRIIAGAFGPGFPRRDLRVSPRHAIFFEGYLFEALSLVNGGTVVQEHATASITYHHIELDQHDVVLAEGMPAESFLNQGRRGLFEGERTIMLHPNFGPADELEGFCVPVIRSGSELAGVRMKILARAATLGFVPTETASLEVFVESRRLKPVAVGHYLLPEDTTVVDLRSPVGFADQTGPVISDMRALGVALGEVLLTTGHKTQKIDLSGSHSGLYETLDRVTWTNGFARLAMPPFKGTAILIVKPIRHIDRLYRSPVNVPVVFKHGS